LRETRSHFRQALNTSQATQEQVGSYWTAALCGLILLLVCLVFGQTLLNEFLDYDDDGFVYRNPHVTAGLTLSGLRYAMTDGPYGEWCPITTLSHMLDCQLYGLDPTGHFLTNVLLHAASSVLLFLVLLRMTGDLWPSAWVGAIFAIHPLHVESVAWLAERRDVLSGLFFMLILGAYTIYVERPSLVRYLAVVGCLALGLMAKPMLVTVPFLLLLLDYWPLDRFRQAPSVCLPSALGPWLGRLPVGWRLVVEKLPLLALAALVCGIVLSSHSSFRLADQVDRLSLAPRVANALVAYVAYLGQTFYPVDLSPYYPHPGTHLPMASAAEALVLLATITAVAAFYCRCRSYLLVGWLWYLGMLVPVLGLVGVFTHARADRYTYLSQIGLSIAVAWGVWDFYRWRQSLQAASWRRWTLAVASAATVVSLATVAWQQTTYWRNAEALWTHAVDCTEHNLLGHYDLAKRDIQYGRTGEAIANLREAVAGNSLYREMIASSHDLLADQLLLQGKIDEAFTHYEQAVQIAPTSELPRACLAMELARTGRQDEAIAAWHETVRVAPASLRARLSLANALLGHEEASEAADECREALIARPDSMDAVILLGRALVADHRVDEAVSSFEHAMKLDPRDPRPHFHLGQISIDRGQPQIALAYFGEAIRLQPNGVSLLWQTAWMLATSPDPSIRDGVRAVKLASRAVTVSDAEEVRAFDALAAALAETGDFSAAIKAADEAAGMALARGNTALAETIDERARLYRQGLPYHQPAPVEPPEGAPELAE
jgi:protein O-mannosyl-transferase